jgi:hypothetical protein
MTADYIWFDAYKSALLETDWTKIQKRLQLAESEIAKRQYVLSMDHGGTPEERQAIADALNGITVLRTEVAQWQTQPSRGGEATTTRD